MLIVFGAIIVIGRKIYTNIWIALTVLVSCPFMAFAILQDKDSFNKSTTQIILFVIISLSGLSAYSSAMSKQNAYTKLQSVFLKGQIKHHQVWVEEQENDNGEIAPPHYETEYYFNAATNQPKFISSIIDWGLFILEFGIPVLTWFIMRKDLL